MLDKVKFYLTFIVIECTTLLFIIGTAIYLLRRKVTREKLRWIFVVLGLLFTCYVSESLLAGLYIS